MIMAFHIGPRALPWALAISAVTLAIGLAALAV